MTAVSVFHSTAELRLALEADLDGNPFTWIWDPVATLSPDRVASHGYSIRVDQCPFLCEPPARDFLEAALFWQTQDRSHRWLLTRDVPSQTIRCHTYSWIPRNERTAIRSSTSRFFGSELSDAITLRLGDDDGAFRLDLSEEGRQ